MRYACVAGMHRSGTSVLARALQICGVDLGDHARLMPPKPDNPEGFFEHLDFVDLNTRILQSFGGDWDLPPTLPTGWEEWPTLAPLRKEAETLLRTAFKGSALHLWKDPRNSLTLPLWLDLCPDLRVIVCLRGPLRVAESMNSRGGQSVRFGLNLWETYHRALALVVQPSQALITHYDALRSQPHQELKRILTFLEMDVPDTWIVESAKVIRTDVATHIPEGVEELALRGEKKVLRLYDSLRAQAGPQYDALPEAKHRPLENAATAAREPNLEPQVLHSLSEGSLAQFRFGAKGNADQYCGLGWSGPEPNFRWMVGASSTLKLPSFPEGCKTIFANLAGFRRRQRLTIKFDGTEIANFLVTDPSWYSFNCPATVTGGSHLLEFFHPDFGRPCDHDMTNADERELAICAHDVLLLPWSPFEGTPSRTPEVAAPQSDSERKRLAMRFQSLGQNCEFGLFQRRCGAEPLGVLRFASIEVARLIEGLELGFADIGNDGLDLIRNEKMEWHGRHKRYGLNYHTFNFDDQLTPNFLRQERARLDYLARQFREQMTGAEKIFVIQGRQLNLEQVLPVLRLLQLYSRQNRLLWVTPTEDALRVGRVDVLANGFCKGYIDRLAPAENAHDLSFDCWLQICAAAAEAMP